MKIEGPNKNTINADLSRENIGDFIVHQLNNYFPDQYDVKPVVYKNLDEALDRVKLCLSHIKLPSHQSYHYLHSDLHAKFIYYLSNTIWNNDQDKNAAAKLFYLNKTLHTINCMYDTVLPDVFCVNHGIGAVLGKANYDDFFVFFQNVTVGANKGVIPNLGKGTYMGPYSTIIGDCTVGDYTTLSLGTRLLDTNTKGAVTLVQERDQIIEKRKSNIVEKLFFYLND